MRQIARSITKTRWFFFQAEDGIRDHCVTGVQTCALPICTWSPSAEGHAQADFLLALGDHVRGHAVDAEIGRASCRERVYISVVAVSLKQKHIPSKKTRRPSSSTQTPSPSSLTPHPHSASN